MGEKRIKGDPFAVGDGGIPILAVQQSATASMSSEGKYAPLQVDENGFLKIVGSITTSPVSNQTVNISQVGGNTAATGGSGILQVASNVNQIGGSTAVTAAAGVLSVGINSAGNGINISQVGGNTAATGGAGILSINKQLVAGQAIATGGTGIQSVDIRLGSTNVATGGAGIISFNKQLLAGQTIATGGTGVQAVDIRLGNTALATAAAGTISINNQLIAGQAIATGGTGLQSFDLRNIGGAAASTAAAGVLSIGLGRVGGAATVTASAGIMKVNAIDSFDIATIYSSGSAKKPTFLQISASASGSNVLIASAASTTYVILAYNLMSNGAVNAQFLSSATPMGGIVYMPTAGVGKVAPFCPVGWMQTTAAHSLNINLSANVAVGGEIVYISI